jgi:hypothetical protein
MMLNDEFEKTLKEAVTAYFKLLPQHLPGSAEKNHENFFCGTKVIPKVRSPKRWVIFRAAVGNPVAFVASPTTTKHART